MMESASEFVEHIIDLGSDADMAEKLCVARDAAIRKECADREAQLIDAAKAFQELATCYRIGKRPTEKLFARLEKANAAIMEDDNETGN